MRGMRTTEQELLDAALETLRGRGDRASLAVANALDPERPTGPRGRQWFERIEARRKELLDSTRVIVTPPGQFGNGLGTEPLRENVSKVCHSSKSPRWGRFLFRLLRNLKPFRALELGTCLGISAAYEGAALELNQRGLLLTLDGMAARMEVADETLELLDLGRRVETRLGRFQQTLERAIADLDPIEFAFIDGHHEESATLGYWQQIAPHMTTPGVVVFDDIDWSDGMRAAWKALVDDPRFGVAVDLGDVGVCILGEEASGGVIRAPLML